MRLAVMRSCRGGHGEASTRRAVMRPCGGGHEEAVMSLVGPIGNRSVVFFGLLRGGGE